VQYILKDEEPIIIEITRRAPGDLYVKFVEYATGVDYANWIVKAAVGLDCSEVSQVPVKGFFTRHCIMSSKEGIVKDIVFDLSIKDNVIDQFVWGNPGYEINDLMTSKLGIVFLKFDSRGEMLDKTENMQELIWVEVR
jgi:hypothetical protein